MVDLRDPQTLLEPRWQFQPFQKQAFHLDDVSHYLPVEVQSPEHILLSFCTDADRQLKCDHNLR